VDPQREVPRTDELWYFENRDDVGDWLRRHGWQVDVTPSVELMDRYGRKPAADLEDDGPRNLFVSAQRAGT
jgi:O-methyltransferase involved in polyketide biosynthesis